jgi:hypothetical protein
MYSDALDLYYRRKVAEWNYNTDIAKAREKIRNEIMFQMFQDGLPPDQIAKFVKIPPSEVLSIRASSAAL